MPVPPRTTAVDVLANLAGLGGVAWCLASVVSSFFAASMALLWRPEVVLTAEDQPPAVRAPLDPTRLSVLFVGDPPVPESRKTCALSCQPLPGMEEFCVERVGARHYRVAAWTADPPTASGGCRSYGLRIVPAFVGGEPRGFKVFVVPGYTYAALGLESGDIVRRVNGMVVRTPEDALDVYQRVRTASTITVDVERQGQELQLEYEICLRSRY
ncbi:MAG: hypothetical protein QM767_19860 [Anaeromyxobacter sp.]